MSGGAYKFTLTWYTGCWRCREICAGPVYRCLAPFWSLRKTGIPAPKGFRHERNWLREKETALQGWEGVELMTVVEWCESWAKDLRFIGREFHKRGEELRNDPSTNLSLMETVEEKDTDDMRNEFCWEVWYLWACEGTLVWLYGGCCV